MDYLPLFAKLQDKPCLVVGGGEVALRKTRQLLRAGARVSINAPVLCSGLRALAAAEKVTQHGGEFDPGLVESHWLIIAATDDRTVNQAVANAADRLQRLCNVVDDGETSAFIMPAVVDRSPIVVAISSGGRAPIVARWLRQQLDDWLPERIGELANWAGSWRQRVAEKIRTHAQRVHFWQDLLDGPAAEHLLAGRKANADQHLITRLQTGNCAKPGQAWLVGAGSGNPGLLTRRGLELLRKADTVMHDALVSQEILDLARRDTTLVAVGKRGGQPSTAQADINRELVARVSRGERVCRLKGGDPMVFGRGGEELQALAKAGLSYEVVPGITAANACAAYAGVPLTHRHTAGGYSVLTGHHATDEDSTDLATLAGTNQTLVIYMALRRLHEICLKLQENGRSPDTPALLIEQGTRAQQKVVQAKLQELPAKAVEINAPALLIVGDVVKMAGQLNWFQAETAAEQFAANG